MPDTVKAKIAVGYEIMLRIAFPILLGITAWTFMSINDHEKRIITMEASVYMQADANREFTELRKEFTDLKMYLTRIETILEERTSRSGASE